MKNVIVLGSGCAKCTKTADIIATIADKIQVDVTVVKETNPEVIMSFGVMSTPAVVVDNQVVHSGSIPHRDQIETWLK